jgi:group II intron reverse transcriptase/maturase
VGVASEKSDEAVVPKKSTKDVVTPSESLEGRAEAKGKSAVRNTLSTQGDEDVLTQLQRIRAVAKEKPEEKINNLLSHMKIPLLRAAYYALRRDAAVGVDKETWHEYGKTLEAHLPALQERIQRNAYHPLPVRRVQIPKLDGKTRPLGIPALEDKIVQQAAKMLLEPVYEELFLGFSYGFRPKRSAHNALDAVSVMIEQRDVGYLLDADIRAFFDTISHEEMKKMLEKRISDKRMVFLVLRWLKAGVMEDGKYFDVEKGTPQGGIISPLLANIYLHYVLDEWVHNWRKTEAEGHVCIVRYADDFVIAFEKRDEARFMEKELKKRFEEHGLALHPEKTRLIRFGAKAQRIAASKGRKLESFTFLGFTHIASETRARKRFCIQRITAKKKRLHKLKQLREEMRTRMHEPVWMQHKWLCSVLVGYFRYYGVPYNTRCLNKFRHEVMKSWYRALQRRSQRGKWSQEAEIRFTKRYPLPPARLCHPFPSERLVLC